MLLPIASLSFSGGSWALAGAGLAALGAAIAIVNHRRRPGAPPAALALRLLALALLALCLAEPTWVGEEAEPGANILAVVADNSLGMTVRGEGETRSRGEELSAALTDEDEDAEWLQTAAETFRLRRFTVDDRLRRVGSFSAMQFAGESTGLGAALESLARRFAGRPIAGVVLLTDGNSTDAIDPTALADLELPPIYPVVFGENAPDRDLAVTAASISESSFEDAPLTVRAEITAFGYRGQRLAVRLLDAEGEAVESVEITPGSDAYSSSQRFLHRPAGRGVQFYRVEVSRAGEEEIVNDEEATLANNARSLVVNRGRGPYRILYVSGRPNWEFKFLNRSVAADDELELVGLLRVARREPKFQWRGKGGAGNPLFRGFGNQDDTAEFDQPVLIRLNTRDGEELSNGFPRVAEELFAYHAIIIDDLERAFFTVDQLDLLDSFVARRGGSLLMLGGAESFGAGSYQKTPVAKMLPVHAEGVLKGAPADALRLDLTRDGWLSPWMRLRENEGEERERIGEMSSFKTLNRIAGIKPGAQVLAQVDDGGVQRPALVAQRYGKGRTSALLIADMWRWGFRVPEHRPDMEKAWRQLVRWLVADVEERVSVKIEPGGAGAVRARVRVLDENFRPMADARVSIELDRPGNGLVELSATPSDTEPGVFETTFVPDGAERALVKAHAIDASGEPVGNAADGWASSGAADEFKQLEPNRELMEQIAKLSSGEVLQPRDLDRFAKRLPTLDAPETRTWTRPLWHTPPVFLLVLACFAFEWILRRRAGMA